MSTCLGSSVLQFGGTAIGVPGYPLSNLKGTSICKEVGNAGCAKPVCRIMLLQAGLAQAQLESCWRPPSEARGRSENVPEPQAAEAAPSREKAGHQMIWLHES
jgi:hypothetical protein